ncbi:hypothetical protein EVAR_28784_1 [Eumeta japonica]|uniref:Uncharacterized protein n=1 Tax=Eumeta variegata TaxID=151549 RepID=A0A4C1VGR9_EUMVA|nr:hypothetical protein EVAR_28784_1 [Eumeta japonica]
MLSRQPCIYAVTALVTTVVSSPPPHLSGVEGLVSNLIFQKPRRVSFAKRRSVSVHTPLDIIWRVLRRTIQPYFCYLNSGIVQLASSPSRWLAFYHRTCNFLPRTVKSFNIPGIPDQLRTRRAEKKNSISF